MGGIPTEADLVVGSNLLSNTRGQVELVESGRFKQEAKKLDKALRVCGDVRARCEWFNDYLNEGLDGQEALAEKGKGKSLGAPPEQVIKCALMSKLGFSESEVLNRPFSLSLWDIAAIAEMDGSLRIFSEEDARLQEQVKELERQIEEGAFDPAKIMNN